VVVIRRKDVVRSRRRSKIGQLRVILEGIDVVQSKRLRMSEQSARESVQLVKVDHKTSGLQADEVRGEKERNDTKNDRAHVNIFKV
jgi:hypothetical protein